MKIGEFFVQLGVKADTGTVKDFVAAIGQLPMEAAAGILALGGLGFSIGEIFKSTLHLANGLGIFSASTGLSTLELQRWEQAAKRFGISGETVQSTIQGLANASRAKYFMNMGPTIAAGRLGIRLSDDPFKTADALHERLKTFKDKVMFTQLAGQLGVSPDYMRVLAMGDKDYYGVHRSQPLLDNAGQGIMQDFQKSVADFTIAAQKFLIPFIEIATPLLTKLTEFMAKSIPDTGPGKWDRFKDALPSLPKGGVTNFRDSLLGQMIYGGYVLPKDLDFSTALSRPSSGGEKILAKVIDLLDTINSNSQEARSLHVTQHITGSSDPTETGRASAEEFAHANKHLNRGGR